MTTHTTPRFHAAVIGAGLVGISTALALARVGLNVALIAAHLPTPPGEDWDTRVYAISPSSEAFLSRLGAWRNLDMNRVQPVFRMEIWGDRQGYLRLDAYEAGVPKLASIVESGHLQHALWQAAREQDTLFIYCPAGVTKIQWGSRHSMLWLNDGSAIQAELIVGADGRASPIRTQAGIDAYIEPYGQSGVVANFSVALPHRGTAFQWFRHGDVIAYLPLPGSRMSLVWSTSTGHAEALIRQPAKVFCEQVMEAGHRRLGKLELLTPAAAFPLSLVQVAMPVKPGCALVGDAAHSIHPLAGQGVNLGFGDAEALASVLAARGHASCGDPVLLERYARRRVGPVARMQAVTDGLLRLYSANHESIVLARNDGMNGLNRIGPLKSALIHKAVFN